MKYFPTLFLSHCKRMFLNIQFRKRILHLQSFPIITGTGKKYPIFFTQAFMCCIHFDDPHIAEIRQNDFLI